MIIGETKTMITITRRVAIFMLAAALLAPVSRAESPDIRIFGSAAEIIAEYKRGGYWGEIAEGSAVSVPPYLTVATSPTWNKDSARLPVAVKKELFYRSLLPLVLYSNETIHEDRTRLQKIAEAPRGAEREWLAGLAIRYGLLERGEAVPEGGALSGLVAELGSRVDTVPPSLALGQAAYESGYGTSRFAREGNALFGQWTYGGKGMQPKQKRASKGNYGVAAYDWPLESVRGYMRNLNTHRAYQKLRDKRAAVRRTGQEPTGSELADTLTSYSERGAAYVTSLKGIMRTNELAVADAATLQTSPAILIIDVPGEEAVAKMKQEIATLRETGQLDEILADMGVDFD
jgi:uncharacterized FlgJ-related protein